MRVSARPRAKASIFLSTVALALLASLSACETPPPPPPPPAAPVAVEPPPPPPVLLPRSVVELAGVYEDYVAKASAIDPAFTSGETVATALKTAETYQTAQFQKGQAAYGAIAALQDPAFVAALRAFAKDAGQRAQVASMIMADPNYASSFQGADSAAGLVIGAFSDQGRKLIDTGARIRQAAYDVQHQSWSKAEVTDRPGRLALAKALAEQTQPSIEAAALRLSDNAAGRQAMGLAAPPAAGPYTPLVARSLAVAAMAALGEGGDEYAPQLTALLADNAEGQCLSLAKLDLYQCLSVAKPHYEDVFCLGQHGLGETGQCMMKGAVARYVIPPPVAEPTPKPGPVRQASSSKHGGGKKKLPVKAVKTG